jgi:hypothetical protein
MHAESDRQMSAWPTSKLVEFIRRMERRHAVHDDPACLGEADEARSILLRRWEAARERHERSHNV